VVTLFTLGSLVALLFVLVIIGSAIGLVFKLVFWLLFLPFRIAFKLLFLPFLLIKWVFKGLGLVLLAPIALIGLLVGGLGLLAMRPAQGALPWYGLTAGLLVIGAGMGLTQSPVTLAVTGIVPQAQMGVATGIFHMGRFVSGSLGTTVFGLILAMEAAGMAAGFQHNLLAVVIAAGVAVIATRLLPGRLAAIGSQAKDKSPDSLRRGGGQGTRA